MRFPLPLIALAAIAMPATAKQAEETVTVRIGYADLNVATSEGRAVLEQRVEAELRKACTVEIQSRYSLGREIIDEKCIAEARAEALAEVERVVASDARRGRSVAAN